MLKTVGGSEHSANFVWKKTGGRTFRIFRKSGDSGRHTQAFQNTPTANMEDVGNPGDFGNAEHSGLPASLVELVGIIQNSWKFRKARTISRAPEIPAEECGSPEAPVQHCEVP